MQKSFKRTLSLILAVVMLCAVLTVAPFTAGAATADSESVGWTQVIAGEITVDQSSVINYSTPVTISRGGDIALLKFVPTRAMKVEFFSTISDDTYGYIYDSSKSSPLDSDDDSGGSSQFKVSWNLAADTTYYFGARFYNSSYTGTINVTLIEIPIWEHSGATITKYNGIDSNVTVPSELDGVAITAIGDTAFSYNSSITSVTIPAGITSVGDRAFNSCSNLETVTFALGSSLTAIGDNAFAYCTSLTTVNFEDLTNLTSIGSGAFCGYEYNRTKLKYVNLPEGLTSIGANAFSCSGAGGGYLIVPSTVTYAGGTENNQTAFYMAHYNTMIFKTRADCFELDFDRALYTPYAACYEDSRVEYMLEHGSVTVPNEGSAHHIKSHYTVTYDANLPDGVQATVPAATQETDDVITLSNETPTAGTYHYFLGWGFSPTDTVRYHPGDIAAFCSDVTLYAVWRERVTFIDGEETVATKNITLDDKPSSGRLTYSSVRTYSEGKVLMGYFTEPNGAGTRMFDKDQNSGSDTVQMSDGVEIADLMRASDAQGEIKLYAYWEDAPEIAGRSISLNGDVTMNYFVSLPAGTDIDDYQSANLQVGYSDYLDLMDADICVKENGYYKVSVKRNFKEIADTFDVTLYCNGTYCDTMENSSIKSYAENIINGSNDEYLIETYGYSADKIAALKELCKAMLSLGARAQEQFDYNTYYLADQDIDYTVPTVDPETLAEPDYSVNGARYQATAVYTTDSGIKFINMGSWEKVYITYSYEGEFISAEMTKTDKQYEGYDVYKYSMPGDISTCIRFSDGPVEEGDNGDKETHAYSNLTDSCYFYDYCIGYSYYPYSDSYIGDYNYTYWSLDYNYPSSSDSDMRFINTLNWEHVYVWEVGGSEAFPGTEMTFLETNEDGEKIYSAPRPSTNAELVFSDGTQAHKTTSVSYAEYLNYYNNEGEPTGQPQNLDSTLIPMWKAMPCDIFSELGISYEGSNIGLFNRSAYGIILRNNSASGFTVSRNGTEVEGMQIEMNLDDNYYYYRFYDIPAISITENIQLTLHVDSVTDPVTGTVTHPADKTVSFNPISYIKRALSLDDSYATLKATVAALYDFNQKAAAFFATE